MNKQEATVQAFREYISQNGWVIVLERDVQNGKQFQVHDNVSKVSVICYMNGNAVVQGDESSLKSKLQTWVIELRKKKVMVNQQEIYGISEHIIISVKS